MDLFSKYLINSQGRISGNASAIFLPVRHIWIRYSFTFTYSDDRLPDSKSRSERERKQIHVEVSRCQKWAEMINSENVKKYFGTKVW